MALKEFARSLRNNTTDVERTLWRYLRKRQIEGFKFRRQVVIEPYIVDFVCFDAKMIIELDGGQHQRLAMQDKQRDEYLSKRGYKILRFWNHDVVSNIEGVLESIRSQLISRPSNFAE